MGGGEENVEHPEFCSFSMSWGTRVSIVAGAWLVARTRKPLAPLVFFSTAGPMVDIIMGTRACEREHAERQMKLLEDQNAAAAETLLDDTNIDS